MASETDRTEEQIGLLPKSWLQMLQQHDPEFVWLRFMLLNGSYLVIMIPTARFSKMLQGGMRVSVASAVSHGMRNDHVAEGASISGALCIAPDLLSAYICPAEGSRRVEIMSSFVGQDGAAASICARSKLADLTRRLRSDYDLVVLLGFEIEVVFVKGPGEAESHNSVFTVVGRNHSWCNITSEDVAMLPMIEEIVQKLSMVDAAIEKFHAESAPGQWEFVLSPRSPVEAVDMLLRARETIATIAQQHGMRATLHPRPYPEHAGTGAHTHISANPIKNVASPNYVESFFAGILMHLPSIVAFAMPLKISYNRIATGIWSGGEYVFWGWENRETPLRRIDERRFEFKLMCGTANPYITMCAILLGAIDGLDKKLPLVAGDCQAEAANLSAEERASLQILQKLPTSIGESLQKLRSDEVLVEGLGKPMISAYIALTERWNKSLGEMETQARENWLVSRY